jgi:hypothetical protein
VSARPNTISGASQLSDSRFVKAWLDAFPVAERETARILVDEILLVGADEFKRGLTDLLDQIRLEHGVERPIALYVEREVETDDDDEVLPLIAGTAHGRATGDGPNPVPFDSTKPEIGSEGLLANLITNYCRLHAPKAMNHPGPDLLRKYRAGPIVIVADFIGSGNRVWEMLEAFRAIATFRSWRSYRLIKFFVVAYSGTEEGIRLVQSSGLRPTVSTVAGCPTVTGAFRGAVRDAVYQLCRTYPPSHSTPLGYGYSGALIAFEHGVPNNAPPILHSNRKNWRPLFKRRSTIEANADFPPTNAKEIANRAEQMLRVQNAQRFLADARGRRWIHTMLVLAAIDGGARTAPAISAQTRLHLPAVREILAFTLLARWTKSTHTLTKLGRAELRRLRKRRARTPVLPKPNKPFYYPSQLRAR